MNPRVPAHESLKNEEAVANGSYSHVEVNGASLELVERNASRGGDLLPIMWRERRFIAKAFAIGLLVAAIVSVLIPSKYEATTRIMPPEKQGLSGLAGLMAAASSDDKTGAGTLVGGLVSDAIGFKSPGALYVGVLKSSTVQDALIDRFDLRKVYHDRYRKDAREDLADNTDIDEDRKSGIITVRVTDRSPQRATQMAQTYVETLNRLTAQLNSSAAHRERLFIEDRLKGVKEDLDAAAKNLSEFSSKNLTLDVKEQGKAMVTGVATLEGELIATESQLSGLEQIYTSNNVRVRSLQARVNELKRNLSEMRGTSGDAATGSGGTGDDFVSIAKLPILWVTYYDLFRRVKMQETVFEILTKEYELSKINEAKELPTIKTLDEAKVPETRSSPKRLLIILLGGIVAAMLATGYVVASVRLRAMDASHPLSLFGLEVREGLADDMGFLRSHTPERVRRIASRLSVRNLRKADKPSISA